MLFKRKSSNVKMIRDDINTSGLPWCSSARLVYVTGNAALKTKTMQVKDAYYGCRYLSQITLCNKPLIQIDAPSSPTCASLLATGYGIEQINCPELLKISEAINAQFVDLDTSISVLSPLLGLLESGLYVLADVLSYPTDGNGHFFWDVPNELTENPATTGVMLIDDDFEYVEGFPVFLYPTQNTDCFIEDRVNYYIESYKTPNTAPRAIAYQCSEFVSMLLDGHHKACAAARLGESVRCITIIPFRKYQYEIVKNKSKISALLFSSLEFRADDIPSRYLPDRKKSPEKSLQVYLFEHATIRHEWDALYLASKDNYPTLIEYAELIASEISDASDELIQECLADLSDENQKRMKGILLLLRLARDPRLKQTALDCAKKLEYCRLKVVIFRILAKIKDDAQIEQFFLDYLLEDSDQYSLLAKIASAYWEEG